MRWSASWSGVACALAAVTAPCVAAGQSRSPRIAVGPFTGERAAVTRSMVAGVFANHAGEVELASQSEYNAVAARLGVAAQSDESSVAAVARELRVDEVVVGSLERQGTGFRLRLRVIRSRDGRGAGSASWEFERIEEINALTNEIWEQLRGSFRVDSAAATTEPAQPTDTPRPLDGGGATGDPTPPAGDATGDRPSEAGDARLGEAPTPGLGWLWIHLAGGLSGRNWRVPVLGETTQRGYDNNAFGELRGTVAAYYRLNHNRLGVGVETTLGIPLGLSSQGKGPDGRVVPIATSAIDLQFGASLIMRPWNGGMLRAFVGLAYQSFSLDTSRLSPEFRLAPVTYVGLRVAGEGTLPLYASRAWEVGVIFGGELRVSATGSEMKEAFGTNPDTTLGFGTWFGLGFRLDRAAPGLGLRATAEFLRYATDFNGPARIGTPGESLDDYARYLLTVTYAVGTERAPRRPPASATYTETTQAPVEEGSGTASGTSSATGDPFGGR